MDESNKAAGNPAEAPAAPAVEAKPVVPTAAKNTNSVVPAGKPGSSKGLIIGLCVGGAAIILIVVLCIIFIPMLFGIDWEKTKEATQNFEKANNSLSTDCGDVLSYATSTYKSESDYNKSVEKCSTAIQGYKDAAEELGKSSGVKKDKEIKEKYDKFKEAYDKASPALDQITVVMKDVHSFVLKMDEFEDSISSADDITDAKIDELVKPLADSENEGLKAMGEDMKSQIKSYIEIVKKYNETREAWYNTSSSDPNYPAVRDAYYAARDAYYDADFVEPDMEMEDLLGVSEDDLDKLDETAEALVDKIRSQYNKNN